VRYQVAPYPVGTDGGTRTHISRLWRPLLFLVELHPYRAGDEPRTRYIQPAVINGTMAVKRPDTISVPESRSPVIGASRRPRKLDVGLSLYGEQVSRKTRQGDVGVATAILHYSRQPGTTVSIPTTEHCRYDLIIEDDRGLLRVQVKTSSFNARSGVYEVQLRTNGANYTTKNKTVKICCEDVDLVFILTGDGHAYEVPSKRVDGMTTVSMSRGWLKFKVGEYPPLAHVVYG
jgi:hypothetical protein